MSRWTSKDMSLTNVEEFMMKLKMNDKEDFKNIQNMNIFYQAGTSKQGYPVFYYIVRRFKYVQIVSLNEILIFAILILVLPMTIIYFDFQFRFSDPTK